MSALLRSLAERFGRSAGVLIPLVALWIALAIASPQFLTVNNFTNLLLQSSVIGVMAFATTFVIITEEIDLSIGAIQGLGAVIAALLMVRHGVAWPLAVAAALAAGVVVGLINGLITTVVGVPSFITTLATLGLVTGITLNLTDGQSVYNFPAAYQWIGQGELLGIKAPVLIAVAVLVLLQFLLRRTTLGLKIYAVGGNKRAAALVGIRPNRVKTIALVLSGAGAALAGVLVSARLNTANPEFGSQDLLNAIAAVVIGGTSLTGGRGSIVDTAFGVLVISTVNNGLDLLGVSPFWKQSAIGAMILLVAILDVRNRDSATAWRPRRLVRWARRRRAGASP
jgi:ribose/xylose/arabinose/galactoside ABC-type transport system permease subunit